MIQRFRRPLGFPRSPAPATAAAGGPARAAAAAAAFIAFLAVAGLGLAVTACEDEPAGPTPEERAIDAAAETITAERIAASIDALAHDSTLGRGTHTPEQDEAAMWIAARLEAAGVVAGGTEGYLQPFDYIPRGVIGDESFVELPAPLETPSLSHGHDFIFFPPAVVDTTGPLLWGGSITDETPAAGLDIAGAFVLVDHPGPTIDRAWIDTLFTEYAGLNQRRPAGLGLVVSPGIDEAEMAAMAPIVGRQRWFRDPVFLITEAAAERLVGAAGTTLAGLREGGPTRVADAFRTHAPPAVTITRPSNVVGIVEGSDPTLEDSYVVVSAHYDHLGVGFADATGDGIHNGADDNASGTAGLLEVARAMAALETPPARSVLFLATAAEELGLIGASRFLDAATVPRSAIVANINLDMISRNEPGQVAAIGKDYTTMGRLVEDILRDHPEIGLFASHQGGDIYFGGSDHAPFARLGIPAIFFFAGLHDDYHRPSDEPDTNDDDKAARIARLAFYLARAVADDPEPVELTDLARRELGM